MQKNYSDSFLKKTIEIWQPRYGHPLTIEDAREIAFNTTALVKYLTKLNKKYGSGNTLSDQTNFLEKKVA